jgi:DNA invertase Pin-like site-specific DNA recombinase
MAKIGYARISTEEQNLALQLDALRAAGCEIIYRDEGFSGAASKRPGLEQAIASLAPGDTLAVWKLDRLGRSLSHLIEVIDRFGKDGVGFQSLSESIDTTTAGGRLLFHLMGALAEFERALIAERTKAGMKAAKQRGKHVGRPRTLSMVQVEHARTLIEQGSSRRAAAELFGVHHNTLTQALKRQTQA